MAAQDPLPQCSATKANGLPCPQKAPYRCTNQHTLCVQHALRLGGDSRRRQTDRKCTMCMAQGVAAKVEWLKAPPVGKERRSNPPERTERSA